MATEVGSLQASLSLDISNFSRSMQAAVSMVQQLGRQLQAALGNTQGFSALQRSAADLKAEIESIIASIKNMQAVLGNTQNATAIFTAIRQHTSGLSGDFDKIHLALQEIISLLQQLNGAVAGVASSTSQMASNMTAFNAASQTANRQARQTSTNSRQASSAIRNASTQANRLANNLQKGAGFAANLKHIVEGIVISQAFYKMLNIMQDLVAESFQFMNNMAQTEIAFKYLLGSEEDAKSMLESLQDLSITSPISTADATEMSRKLMAMGFSAKSVIPTLKILTDTAAVFTNEAGEMNDMMSHVVVALGQMKSAGTVSMQELRQLYNAGIPIFQILQDGLGLTADQVRNIGKLGVDSGTAILAILNELQKKYTGAAEEMTRTIPGALEVIQDGLYVINNILFSAPFQWVTEQLNRIADRISAIVQIARVYGAGGIFQAMFPREWQMALRNIIGTFQELGKALTYIGKTVAIIFKGAMEVILNVAAVVGPPLSILIHTLSMVAYWIMVNVPLVRRLLTLLLAYTMLTVTVKVLVAIAKAMKLLAIAQAVATMVVNLCKALRQLWAFSKVGFILMMIAGAFLAVALSSEKAKNAIMAFFGKIQSASKKFSDSLNIGFNPNEIAQPDFTPPKDNNQWSDVADGLKDIADGYDDVADSADNATKKQKKNQSYLQSFDEVFQIDPKKNSGSDSDDDPTSGMKDKIDDLMKSLGDLDSTMNGMDWTGDFWKDWGNLTAGLDDATSDALDVGAMAADFWKELVDAFKAPEWVGAGLGALIGGLFGALLGHPLIGTAIGALCGWIAGLFWDDLKDGFSLSDLSPLVATIATVLGLILGKLMGYSPLQSILAAAGLGISSMIVSAICGKLADALDLPETARDMSAFCQALGTLLGGALGLVTGHPFLGAAVGNLAGGIAGLFWDGLADKMGVTDVGKISIPLGTAIGGVIGALIGGGPGGALIGGAIGSLAGWIIDGLVSGIRDGDWSRLPEPLGTGIGAGIGLIVGGPAGAVIGAAIGKVVGYIIGKFIEGFQTGHWDVQGLSRAIGTGLGAGIGFIIGGPVGALIGAAIGNVVGWIVSKFIEADWSAVGDAFTQPFKDFANRASEIFHWVWDPIKDAFDSGDWASIGLNIVLGILKGFLGITAVVLDAVATVFKAIWDAFCEIFGIHSPATTMEPIGTNIILGILNGFTSAFSALTSWIVSAGAQIISTIGGWFTNLGTTVGSWVSTSFSAISGWCSNTVSAISSWATNTRTAIGNWVTNTGNSIKNWVSTKQTQLYTWASNTSNKISTWASNTTSRIGTWASTTSSRISTWVSNMTTRISTWVSNTSSRISTWASTTSSKISTAVSSARSAVSSGFSSMGSTISSWASSALSAISSFCSNMISRLSSAVSSAASMVRNLFSFTRSANSARNSVSAHSVNLPDAKPVVQSVPVVQQMSLAAAEPMIAMASADAIPTTSVLSTATPLTGIAGNGIPGDNGASGLVSKNTGTQGKTRNSFTSENDATAFASKVGKEIVSSLAPLLANNNNVDTSDTKQPIYVGTLIADDRGLKELERKLKVIRIKEERRGG